MKRFAFVVLICISFLTISFAAEKQASKPVSHKLLVTDYGGGHVSILEADGKVSWRYSVNNPQDSWMLKNGNILLTHRMGVREVTPDKKVVWEYKIERPNEVHSCQPLKNGNYMVAVSGPGVILEINKDGKIQKTVKLKTNQKSPHSQMRIVRKLKNGNYLVGHNSDRVAREYDPNGKVIREIKVPKGSSGHAAYRLKNGNTLLSTGDGHTIVEVDKNDKIVWQIKENDLKGNPLRYIAGMQRLKNGNTLVSNWGGHGHVGKQPQVFEVTRDKKVVWQLFDNKNFKTISNIQLLDKKKIHRN
jgi:hypothetical protein